jgi:hypothetical protein
LISWATTRDDATSNPLLAGEIYMMNTDLTDVRRITFIDNASNYFPVLSPTGKRMVIDSNRLRGSGPINTSDLFLMNPDGSDQGAHRAGQLRHLVPRRAQNRLPRLGFRNRVADQGGPRFRHVGQRHLRAQRRRVPSGNGGGDQPDQQPGLYR